MASMTTEFYKAKLIRCSDNKEVDYKRIKGIFEKVFEEHAINNDGSFNWEKYLKKEEDDEWLF